MVVCKASLGPVALGMSLLMLAACQPASGAPAPETAQAEPEATPAIDADAITAQAVALVVSDPDCLLREGQERAVQTVDLDGGDVGVIVACASGMVDTWSRLYVSQDGAAPLRAPLIQHDVRGDGRWRDDDDTSELSWDAEVGEFTGVSRSQATGCANGARWRWDGAAIRLVQQWVITCDNIGPDGELPDPVTIWPTDPPTPEPVPDNAE